MVRHASNRILLLALVIVLLVTTAIATADWGSARRSMVLAVVLTALITFFGVLWLETGDSLRPFSDRTMRTALAASAVVSYLVMMGIGVWFPKTNGDFSRMTDVLLPNFSYIVGIVIAFYFGSGAYLEAKERKREKGIGEPAASG